MNARTLLNAAVFAGIIGCVTGANCMMGCAEKGPQYVSPLERANAFEPEREAYAKLGYRHEWTGFPTMTAGGKVEFFDILGDVVVVQESSSVLSVIEAGNGTSRWSDQVANPLTKFVGNIRDDKRVISCSESEAYFFDIETGALVDKKHLDKVVNTRPVIVDNNLVFGTSLGEIFGQLKAVGFRTWGNTVSGAIQTNPAVLGSTLGFISSTGEIVMLDGATGVSKMRTKIFTGTEADPAASDNMMFVASLDHSLYAFAPSSPTPVWRQRTDTPLRHQPTYHDGAVYCAIDGTGLVAFDSRGSNGNARELWTTPGVTGTVIGLRKGRLLLWTGSEGILIDPADGAIVDRAKLDRVAVLKTDAFVDGSLYAVSEDGVVVKLLPKN
ncbi:MAG: PQQ-binding-like beta-propeller repeat protein [Pyrinomonadaceae bacterium]|nr:PQQ-binding-like beta-propeller repeat protein [Phycisphaerales bacterium]